MTSTSFNAGWTVRPKISPFAQLQTGSGAGEEVTLPHDALIGRPRDAAAPSGGRTAYYPSAVVEYLKTFDVPDEYRDKRVTLQLDGVYRDAMVYVNGAFAAQRPYGYSAFAVPLDAFLRYGEPNVIRVDARAHDDSRWYSGVGIHRDTRLVVSELTHLAIDGVRVSTPDIDTERAVVEVCTEVVNESVSTRTLTVRQIVSDAAGAVRARDSAPVTLRPGTTATVRQRMYVAEPALWDAEHPVLYQVATELTLADQVIEETRTRFGVRSLRLDPIHGLRVNGIPVKLRGACIHHDNGPLGAAAIGRAEERRVELLKQAGFNAIRSAHNPVSRAMLDACDRVGMFVLDETFDMWAEGKSGFDYSISFPEWWERDVEAMVAKDFNHPSVIAYSIGNEIFETGDPLGSDWGRRLAEKVRALDESRFVTNGINGFVSVLSDVIASSAARGGATAEGGVNGMINSAADFMNRISASQTVTDRTAESFSVLDIAGINYGDARYALDKELFPNRVIVGTETFPTRIASYWRQVLDHGHVIGDFTWTGWDYLGEVGAGRVQYLDVGPQFEAPFPWLTAWVGDLDITGHRRPISYYRETVYGLRREPYISVLRPENFGREFMAGMWAWSDSLATWTWDAEPGSPIRVEVYSDADEVELLVNGDVVGRATVGARLPYLAEFDTTYQPGAVEAITYRHGAVAEHASLHTAGDPVLAVDVDRRSLRADDTDLGFVAIELRDDAGNLANTADRAVHVHVTGAGRLQALGSARPDDPEPFTEAHHVTFDGRALAVVRPTGSGEITVIVTADGLAPVELTLAANAADPA